MRTVAFSARIFGGRPCFRALAADPTGDWRVADGVANIRVAECNGSMWGAVAWEKTPGGRDRTIPSLETEQADAGHADPDRHEEEACRRSMGRPSLQRQGRPDVQRRRSSRSAPIRWRFKAACWASSAAAKPGPASRPDPLEPGQQHGQGRAEGHGASQAAAQHSSRAADHSRCAEDHRRRQPGPQSRSEAGGRPARRHRRYLPTPRHRAVCPLARAGTTAPRQAW